MLNIILYVISQFALCVLNIESLYLKVVAAARRANKLDRVRTELLALPEMSRIKLRVSAGVFEVSLVRVIEERKTVEVIWDDGIKKEFKWSSIVSGKTDAQIVGQKPTVAAPPPDRRSLCAIYQICRLTDSTSTCTRTFGDEAAHPKAQRSLSGIRIRFRNSAITFGIHDFINSSRAPSD